MNNKILVTALAIFCNILWGSAFPFVKIGYEQFGITTQTSDKIVFAGIRFCIAGLILLVVYFGKSPRLHSGTEQHNRRLPTLHKNNPVGSISFYNFVIPVAGTILSALFLKENILKWNYAGALVLVTIGIYFIQKVNSPKTIEQNTNS